MKLKEGI